MKNSTENMIDQPYVIPALTKYVIFSIILLLVSLFSMESSAQSSTQIKLNEKTKQCFQDVNKMSRGTLVACMKNPATNSLLVKIDIKEHLCEGGHLPACRDLYWSFKKENQIKDLKKAVKYAKMACQAPIWEYCWPLASAYHFGTGSIKVNLPTAMKMYENMCEQHKNKDACGRAEKLEERIKKGVAGKHNRSEFRFNSSVSFNFQDDCSVIAARSMNSVKKTIDIKFFEVSNGQRTGATWPIENDQAYKFKRHAVLPSNAPIHLSCARGTMICYGAKLDSNNKILSWGLSLDGQDSCTSCCFHCGKNAGNIRLSC